jgi:molybdopterin molybdotransferase
MPVASDWIQLQEAWDLIEAHAQPLPPERVALHQARGRVLAQPVLTDRDYPPFPRAAMDGFAVQSGAVQAATPERPVPLPLLGESLPGLAFSGAAVAGTAVRIMTGAPVPEGYDAIVPVERTSGFAFDPVQVQRAVAAGENVAPRGCERRGGEEVLSPGRRLGATEIAVLAMLGSTHVDVGGRPQVAVLATGNELVSSEHTPGSTQIRDANTALLMALAAEEGQVHSLGRSRDAPRELAAHVSRGLLSHVLLVSGGASVGLYDGVAAALEAAGVSLHFRRVALQPGKPVLFGTHAEGTVLALPGNPVSAFTTCRLFALPLLRRLQGMHDARPQWSTCTARFEWRRRSEKTIFLPGHRVLEGAAVERVAYTGSGDLLAYGRADCQIVLPPERHSVAPGESVAIWPL